MRSFLLGKENSNDIPGFCASRASYLHLKDKNLTVLQSRNMLHVDIKCRCGPIQLVMSTLLATVS